MPQKLESYSDLKLVLKIMSVWISVFPCTDNKVNKDLLPFQGLYQVGS